MSALDDFLSSIINPKKEIPIIILDDDEVEVAPKKTTQLYLFKQTPTITSSSSPPILRAPVPVPTFSVKFDGKSPMWMAVRIGSYDIGTALGYNQYKSPDELYLEKVARKQGSKVVSKISAEGQQACNHGKTFEQQTFNVFESWLRGGRPDVCFDKLKHLFVGTTHKPTIFEIANWMQQKMRMENVHKVPDPTIHRLFTDSKDSNYFGATLDVEGDHIDIEIKNPATLASFKKNYLDYISPQYFVQCQLQMAIRQRHSTFFVATHFNPISKEMEGMVVWFVVFSSTFFSEILYPKARHFISSANDLVPLTSLKFDWPNENGKYLASENFQRDMMRFCYKIYYFLK